MDQRLRMNWHSYIKITKLLILISCPTKYQFISISCDREHQYSYSLVKMKTYLTRVCSFLPHVELETSSEERIHFWEDVWIWISSCSSFLAFTDLPSDNVSIKSMLALLHWVGIGNSTSWRTKWEHQEASALLALLESVFN